MEDEVAEKGFSRPRDAAVGKNVLGSPFYNFCSCNEKIDELKKVFLSVYFLEKRIRSV